MNSDSGFNNGTNRFGTSNMPIVTDDYKERVTYDPNGNIKSYVRNGAASQTGGINMDNLTYSYNTVNGNIQNNKLRHVKDAIGNTNYAEDIDDQADDNYKYDNIGNLIIDKSEGIFDPADTTKPMIEWNVYGKISKITKIKSGVTTVINYTYDASGNRISKAVTIAGNTITTRYVRDASGNVMSIYVTDPSLNSGALTQTEAHLYGCSRLGVWNVNRNVSGISTIDYSGFTNNFVRGNKFFELSNHLGNVMVTVSDKQVGVDVGTNSVIDPGCNPPIGEPEYQCPPSYTVIIGTTPDGVVDYFSPDVITANDYYPFGMQMPGRKYAQANSGYRYGFNGKENDNDVKGEGNSQDYGMRIYDTRLGKFLSVDPIGNEFPWNSTYAFAENDPINYIDLDGLRRGNPSRPGGSNGGRVTGLRSQAEALAEGVSRTSRANRTAKERLAAIRHIRQLNTNPEYANNFRNNQTINEIFARESYLQRAFNTAGSVFGGGGISDNRKAGEQWDKLVVYQTMMQNPNYIGVARQVSLKVTGIINGQTVVANIRVDNVGISKDASGKFLFSLVEAKYSINDITINNVRQKLTPQQQKSEYILLKGTNVHFFIRGEGSAANINVFTRPGANSEIGTIFQKDQNITGNISEIKVVAPELKSSVTPKSQSSGTQATNKDKN